MPPYLGGKNSAAVSAEPDVRNPASPLIFMSISLEDSPACAYSAEMAISSSLECVAPNEPFSFRLSA